MGSDRSSWRPGDFKMESSAAGVLRMSGVCPAAYEGGPGIAHGGWIAAFFDELLGQCVNAQGPTALTGELSVRFVKPVPIGPRLVGAARVGLRAGRRRHANGQLVLASSGAVLATASGIFVDARTDHYQRAAMWVLEQEARAGAEPSTRPADV